MSFREWSKIIASECDVTFERYHMYAWMHAACIHACIYVCMYACMYMCEYVHVSGGFRGATNAIAPS